MRSPLSLLALISFLLFTGCEPHSRIQPAEQPGNILISQPNDLFRLQHGWLAQPASGNPAQFRYAVDERSWTPVSVGQTFEDQGFPMEGSVVYRLHVRLPEGTTDLKGFLPYASNAHALFMATPDGKLFRIANSGNPGLTSESTLRSRRATWFDLPNYTDFVLVWHVANFDYPSGGPRYAPLIGSRGAVMQYVAWYFGTGVFIGSFYILVLLLCAILWFRNRAHVQYIALGALSIVLGWREFSTSSMGELLLTDARYPFEVRMLLEHLTFALMPGLIGITLLTLFPSLHAPLRIGKWRLSFSAAEHPDYIMASRSLSQTWRTANSYIVLFTAGWSLSASLMLPLVSPYTMEVISSIGRGLAGFYVPGVWVIIASAMWVKHPSRYWLAVGFAVFTAAGVHDLLVSSEVIASTRFYIGIGSVILVALTMVALSSQWGNLSYKPPSRDQATRSRPENFVHELSREVEKPIQNLHSYLTLLEQDLPEEATPMQRGFVQNLLKHCGQVSALLREVQEVHTLARQRDVEQSLNMNTAVQQALEPRRNEIYKRGFILHEAYPLPDEATRIRIDPTVLEKILLHLFENAIQYMHAGEISVRVDAAAPNDVQLILKDTGIGMSPEFLPRATEAFTREARKLDVEGAGLGLFISKTLTESAHGALTVRSALGKGTTVSLQFPRAMP